MRALRNVDLSEKVALLRRPESFPDKPDAVETIETHFAWIFLSRRFAYKLKKPVRFSVLDLTTVAARRANCELEIALNRRLAAETYIGVVALGRRGPRLELECDDDPVDWLVKMHRLLAEHSLETLLAEIAIDDPRLNRLVDTLCSFYRGAPRAPWSGAQYVRTLERQTHQYAQLRVLTTRDRGRVRAIAGRQLEFAGLRRTLLEGRIQRGRVCDAHGDLRPEHVFLTPLPQIIDCLEFSAELRQLDSAEEISFLALECERRGRSDIAQVLRELYCKIGDDDVPQRLFEYYRSRRALIRAHLSAWHVDDDLNEAAARHWLEQARWYIGEAESSIEKALGGESR